MTNRTSLHNWLTLFSGYEKKATEFYTAVISNYGENHRFYHNLQHISECLTVFDKFRSHFKSPICAEIALWLHDIIYIPPAKDNEEKSADWAVDCMLSCGLNKSQAKKVYEMIVATKAHFSEDPDISLMNDIDLAILGSSEKRFVKYCEAIRKEFQNIPDEIYFPERRKILTSFLNRDKIFLTDSINEVYESNARTNLTRELQRLH